MPSVTLDIPEALYATFLRMTANLLDGGGAPSSPRGEISLADEGEPRSWRFGSLHPDTDDELRLMIDYLKKVKGYARSVIDYLVNYGGPIEGDELARWLQMDSRRAVAGSLGHAARFANELGRKFPVAWDRDTSQYSMDEDLREAIAQARLWIVPAPYQHVIPLAKQSLVAQSDSHPARYALFLRDLMSDDDPTAGFEGLFYDRDAVHDYDPNAFTLDDFLVFEFEPDAVGGEYLMPVEADQEAGFRSERAHDLVTHPPLAQTIDTEVHR